MIYKPLLTNPHADTFKQFHSFPLCAYIWIANVGKRWCLNTYNAI